MCTQTHLEAANLFKSPPIWKFQLISQEMVVQGIMLSLEGAKTVTNPELYSDAQHTFLLNYKCNKKCQLVSLFVHK